MHIQDYEEQITKMSKEQHEYKNQLVVLKGLITENHKKASTYIDEILNVVNENTNHHWYMNLNRIPSNALKGLFYYKISQMQDKNIDMMISCSPELESEKLWEACNQHLQDVSRILGVYLDNAMEAAMTASKRYIIIEIEVENQNVIFTISNTYSGVVDAEHMDQPGFSTKGKGKGYGLALVKDILCRNHDLEQQREINGMYYVQKLIIHNKDEND